MSEKPREIDSNERNETEPTTDASEAVERGTGGEAASEGNVGGYPSGKTCYVMDPGQTNPGIRCQVFNDGEPDHVGPDGEYCPPPELLKRLKAAKRALQRLNEAKDTLSAVREVYNNAVAALLQYDPAQMELDFEEPTDGD